MNKLVTITNKDYIDVIKKEDVTLVYPLKTFSVGYEEYFDIDKIMSNKKLNNTMNR